MYNRVPKCGGSTVMHALRSLASSTGNQFHYYTAEANHKLSMNHSDQVRGYAGGTMYVKRPVNAMNTNISGSRLCSKGPMWFQGAEVFTFALCMMSLLCKSVIRLCSIQNGYSCSSWKKEIHAPIFLNFSIKLIAWGSVKVNTSIKCVINNVHWTAKPALY